MGIFHNSEFRRAIDIECCVYLHGSNFLVDKKKSNSLRNLFVIEYDLEFRVQFWTILFVQRVDKLQSYLSTF